MRFTITSVDYAPEELYAQVPIRGKVLRHFSVLNGPDCYLAELDHPIDWKKDQESVKVKHVLLTPRWVGGVIAPDMKGASVNLAYVEDDAALTEPQFDVRKSVFAAIGSADGEQS